MTGPASNPRQTIRTLSTLVPDHSIRGLLLAKTAGLLPPQTIQARPIYQPVSSSLSICIRGSVSGSTAPIINPYTQSKNSTRLCSGPLVIRLYTFVTGHTHSPSRLSPISPSSPFAQANPSSSSCSAVRTDHHILPEPPVADGAFIILRINHMRPVNPVRPFPGRILSFLLQTMKQKEPSLRFPRPHACRPA